MSDLVSDAIEALKQGYGKIAKDLIAEELEAKNHKTEEEKYLIEKLTQPKEPKLSKLTIQLTDSYLLHFTVSDWKDSKTLKVESQWTGAKNPDDLQTKVQITLEKEKLNQLTTFLSNA
jgi:hypothetical protein